MKKLHFYFGKHFLLALLAVFMGSFLLVLVIDFLEMSRKLSDVPQIKTPLVLFIAVTRVPFFVELMLPFAVLIASIISFITFSKRLEFVVARAAGVSAWQFLSPALFLAFVVGLASSLFYNPFAIHLKEFGVNKEAEMVGGKSNVTQTKLYLRQQSGEGQAVIAANSASQQGQILHNVTFYRFDLNNIFVERIDADSAHLTQNDWLFKNAIITKMDAPPQVKTEIKHPTSLTLEQVRDSFLSPDMVSFWNLQTFIDITEQAGLSALRFKLQFHVLLAKPFLMVAMVLLAASASLRFFRMGGVAQTILLGVSIGFLLYIAGEAANNLGRSGFINPLLAGWLPAVVGCIIGLFLLIQREDG